MDVVQVVEVGREDGEDILGRCCAFQFGSVCAIPGVNMGCAAKLEHTSFNVNWLVSLFWLILLFMIAAAHPPPQKA